MHIEVNEEESKAEDHLAKNQDQNFTTEVDYYNDYDQV